MSVIYEGQHFLNDRHDEPCRIARVCMVPRVAIEIAADPIFNCLTSIQRLRLE
jgi:hypothetical protein